MIDPDLTVTFQGKQTCFPLYNDPRSQSTLMLAVPCQLGGLPSFSAYFDTGAEWSVLPTEIARVLGYDLSPKPTDNMVQSTRLGVIKGCLEEVSLTFPAMKGRPLDITASFIVPHEYDEMKDGKPVYLREWNGPIFLGWRECIQYIKFAVDISSDEFYFGPLGIV